jgi:hypothetical protein
MTRKGSLGTIGKIMKSSFVSLLALSATVASASSSTPLLEPAGRWVVNFADAQCIANRSYGSGDKAWSLVLKQPPLGDVMQLMVMQAGAAKQPEQNKIKVALTVHHH